MAFRTYAWFYGSDYQLINIHDAKQKEHPYYADDQLYGATDVHTFSTNNFIREVTQRIVEYDEDNHGYRTVYEKGTPAWNVKFSKPSAIRHTKEIMYEQFIERLDGWFEFEIALGFISVDLFESLVTSTRLTEIVIVMYRHDENGALIPVFQHVFQEPQIQSMSFNVSSDDVFSHRLQCRAYYSRYEYQYYKDSMSTPLTHSFLRKSMSLNQSALEASKARVQMASEYVKKLLTTPEAVFENRYMPIQRPRTQKNKIMLHKISSSGLLGYNDLDINPDELEDFYFCIAPREYSHSEFVNKLFTTPTEAKLSNLLRVNSHVGKVIQAGQIVYVVNAKSEFYNKMKPHLNDMARKVDAILSSYPDASTGFFAENFALMGSFAESVGCHPGEYYAIGEAALKENIAQIERIDTVNAKVGLITNSAEKFFELVKNKIELIDNTHYKKPYRIDSQQARIIALKQIREKANVMFDELKQGIKISEDGVVRHGLMRESPIQRWVVKGGKLVSLDKLYQSVVDAHAGMKLFGYAGVGLDAVHTHDKVLESCTIYREDECRRITYKEWGSFLGKASSGLMLAAGLTFVPITGGWSLVIAVSLNLALSEPVGAVGGYVGENIAVVVEEYLYGKG